MAAPLRTSEERASEETPLLPTTETNQQNGAGSSAGAKVKKVARWLADHAIIIFMGLLLAAIIIVLSLYFTVPRPKGAPKAHPKLPAKDIICDSAACVHASSEILYNLSPDYKTLDPCNDFEELVCGGWGDRHDLRADQGDAFTGTIMSENSQMLLRHILEAPYPAESNHSSFSPAMLAQSITSIDELNFNKLKAGYDACMDEDTIKDAGVKPLKEIIHQVADMFPIGKSHGNTALLQAKDSEALSETILYLQKLGISSLISLGAGADDKDPDTVVVQAVPPYKIGLVKNYYKDEKILAKYEATILDVFNALYPDPKPASSTKDTVHGLINFEKELAAASPDTEDAEDVTKYYNPFSLKDADRLTPQIRLAKLVSSLEPADVKTTRIIVGSPEYMKTMSKVLVSTPKEVIHTFFIWKVIQSFASVVEAEELKPYSRFSNELQGKDPESTPERWRFCVNHVDDSLGWILSRFFVEKAFSAKAKDLGDQIVSDIKEMFIEKLKVSTWMDNSVIDLAIEKVHKIIQKIGYPTKSPDIMDPVSLKRYYQTVEISPSDFFRNALEASRFAVAEEWSALGKPVDRDQWGMTTPTVNAYYNPPGNEIVFPAGIMQFPVFDVNVPQYLSYGAFGAVSGHELSHAFDSTGRHYDQNGNYTDWWNKKTVDGFQERAQCFIDQYHNYTVEGPDGKPLHVNGKLTLGENIADAGGITASFAAWQKRRSETPNQDLPGLEHFTQEQLFFVSYANWWCGKSRKEKAIERIYTDPHAPKWARILGTMANSKDFLQSFNCPAKEPVCELW